MAGIGLRQGVRDGPSEEKKTGGGTEVHPNVGCEEVGQRVASFHGQNQPRNYYENKIHKKPVLDPPWVKDFREIPGAGEANQVGVSPRTS